MIIFHFTEYPLARDLWNVNEGDVENKFAGWERKADYTVTSQIVLQIDTTNITPPEYQIAPNLTFITTNQALINIYKTWHKAGVSFSEFREYYSEREMALERYASDLIMRLNNARHEEGGYGDWYVNYALNDRHITVRKPEGEDESP